MLAARAKIGSSQPGIIVELRAIPVYPQLVAHSYKTSRYTPGEAVDGLTKAN
jgi:hypothetical protein